MPTGLPNSPRPPSLRQISPRPSHLLPAPSSLHTRSRSQPPPKHQRLVSTTTHRNEQDGVVLRNSGQHSTRSSSSAQHQPPVIPYTEPPTSTFDESSGNGQAIWSAVSSVTSALTISVSKAWSDNIPTFSGEETPPGQESRLTRAMKAYHIAKAQKPSDLPDWLFDERERRIANTQDDHVSDQTQVQASPPQTNFRPETPSKSDGGRGSASASASASHEATPFYSQLRGSDRLKAMREARKPIGGESQGFASYTRQTYNSTNVPQTATRIGLPSGPQRGRR